MNGLAVLLAIGGGAVAIVVAARLGWLHALGARLRAGGLPGALLPRRRTGPLTRRAVTLTADALADAADQGWAGTITLPRTVYVWLALPGRLADMLENPREQQAFLAKVRAALPETVRRRHGAAASRELRLEGMYALGGACEGERVEVRLSASRHENPFDAPSVDLAEWEAEPVTPLLRATPGRLDMPRTLHAESDPLEHGVAVTLEAAGEVAQTVLATPGEALTVGRHPAATVVLPYLTDLSTWHLRVVIAERGGTMTALIEDTSTYGTFTADDRVARGAEVEMPLPTTLFLDAGRRVRLRMERVSQRVAS